MILADLPSGSQVFADANILVYALAADPQFGPACIAFLERVQRGEITAYSSSLILSNVAHRLMTIEACATYRWSYAGIGRRLKQNPDKVQQLTKFQSAIAGIASNGIQFVSARPDHIVSATNTSRQQGILSNDALIFDGGTFAVSHCL